MFCVKIRIAKEGMTIDSKVAWTSLCDWHDGLHVQIKTLRHILSVLCNSPRKKMMLLEKYLKVRARNPPRIISESTVSIKTCFILETKQLAGVAMLYTLI
jgi:hypothetical protein